LPDEHVPDPGLGAAAAVEQARAAIALTEVQLSTARREHERLQGLAGSNFVAAQKLDAAADRIREAEATLRAIRAGEVDALVTAPVSKAAISALGIPFAGHTEYLGARAGVRRPVMMFAGDRFRVALATTHLPLRKVPALLTSEVILHTLVEFEAGLRSLFGVPEPRIAVAGLNPHAGEEGTLGTEEAERVAPAIASARERGIRCEGPFPADTLFRRERFDGLVALYHDQALPAVKTLDPLSVNVTLGLPFVRTSPDHGTAFDIAGRGIADPAPMRQAILLATRLARAKQPLI